MITKTLPCGAKVGLDVGDYIKPDEWRLGSCLQKGDSFSPFRLPVNSNGPIKDLAVRIEITGRTLQWKHGENHVRVKIIFVGDCEPDTESGGWAVVNKIEWLNWEEEAA